MRIKKMLGVLIACVALAGIAASAAQAQWKIAGTPLGAGNHAAVTVSGGPFKLESTVSKAPIVLKATSVECTSGVECGIDELTTDHSFGQLTFTGVTVEPATCKVPGGSLTTAALTDQIIMDPSGGTATFDNFFPESGTTFLTVKLEGSECPFNGISAPVTGTVTGRTSNTGVAAVTQAIAFSAAEQTTGGGSLKLGTAVATLTGTANNALSGTNAGKTFSAE
jgi:hypothetical protein